MPPWRWRSSLVKVSRGARNEKCKEDVLIGGVLNFVPFDIVPSAMPSEKGTASSPLAVPISIPDDNRVLPVILLPRVFLEVDAIGNSALVVATLAHYRVDRKRVARRVHSVPGAGAGTAAVLAREAHGGVDTLDLLAVDLCGLGVAGCSAPRPAKVVHGGGCNSSISSATCSKLAMFHPSRASNQAQG